MLARLALFALLLNTLAGCYLPPPPRPYYGYAAPRPYYGGWHYGYGYRRW